MAGLSKYKNIEALGAHRAPFVRSKSFYIALSCLIFILITLPVISLIVIAFKGNTDSLAHITEHVLPRVSVTTIVLLAGVGFLSAFIGTITAWLISFYNFPGRKILAWLLVMPLAIPPYIAAYFFSEFLSYSGPLQEAIRAIGGFQSMRDYWSPEAHSLSGAIIILSSVLYPYTYLAVMGLFKIQGGQYMAAARILQSNPAEIFLKILLPLAWPAVAVGSLLAMMECLNDIGAVEYLGVETLTLSVFSVWLNQNDLSGAAQLALILFCLALIMVLLEDYFRRNKIFAKNAKSSSSEVIMLQNISKKRWKYLALVICILPLLPGLFMTFYLLASYSMDRLDLFFDKSLWEAGLTSISLGFFAAVVTTFIALFFCFLIRFYRQSIFKVGTRLSSLGYAIPGTIIALGLFIPLSQFDSWLNTQMKLLFEIKTGLLLSGTSAILIYAYVIRFMAIAKGTLTSGFEKISKNIDYSARSLGASKAETFIKINMPQLLPTIAITLVLVFIDVLKELSATLFLRPFGTDTLATYIYDKASRGLIEDTVFACLILIIAGVIPVAIIIRTLIVNQK